ncbi:MAG: SDR family NAD(P)-dependent oxidoreductase, partial [Sneathiella sp.]|nr:SDR family NAD(P)-dependent oxidoreductase [Sneathiella sp.]
MSKRFQDKTALITGASRGIGAAVAKALAAEGAHVILVARSVGGLEEVDDAISALGGTATLVPLDLLKTDAIDGLASPILERWKKLDILVGAAGTLGKLTPTAQYDPKLWEDVFKLNVHANWRLIRALDPLLRHSDAGRALFVTAEPARLKKLYWAG